MEDLSFEQATEAKQVFLHQDLPPALRWTMNVVGICKVRDEPEAFGVSINLMEEFDRDAILSHFPESLHDNVRIKVVGIPRAQEY